MSDTPLKLFELSYLFTCGRTEPDERPFDPHEIHECFVAPDEQTVLDAYRVREAEANKHSKRQTLISLRQITDLDTYLLFIKNRGMRKTRDNGTVLNVTHKPDLTYLI